MNKLLLAFCFAFLTITFLSCKDEDNGPSLPTEETLQGYWMLDKVEEDGDEIDFDDYQDGLESLFLHFDDNDVFHSVRNEGLQMSAEWSLDEDEITIDYNGDEQELDIVSFNNTQLILEERGYNLTFKKVDEDEFPVTEFTAEVDGDNFDATYIATDVDDDFVFIVGSQSVNMESGRTFYITYDRSAVTEGSNDIEDLDIDVSYIDEDENYYYAIEGEVDIEELSDERFEATFDVVVLDWLNEQDEIEIENGVVKVGIEN